jgi:hypothetical protein
MAVQTFSSFFVNHPTAQGNLGFCFSELSKATAILGRNQKSLEDQIEDLRKMLAVVVRQLECVPKDPDCVKQQQSEDPVKFSEPS